MAAGDREATFTLKAADLSSQPINQIIAVLERLAATQAKQNEASKNGVANTNEFKQSVAGLEGVLAALQKRQLTLIEFNRALDEAANRAGHLADLEIARDKLVRSQNIPEDKKDQTKEQRAQLSELDKQIKIAERSAASADKTLNNMRATLASIGESARTMGASMEQAGSAIQRYVALLGESRQLGLEEVANRQAAREATAAQAEAERRAGEIAKAEYAARAALNQQAIEGEDRRVNSLVAAAARAKAAIEEERIAREKAYEEDQAAQVRIAQNREKSANEAEAFAKAQRRSNATFAFTPLLDQHDRETAAQKDVAVKLKEINDAALAGAKTAARQAEQLAKQREDAEIASANAIINVTRALEKAKTDAATADRKRYEDSQRQRAADLTAQQEFARFEAQLQARAEEAYQQRQEQAAALAKQRNLVAQAQASLPERQSLGVSAEPAQGFSSAAQELSAIMAPAAAARATITGLEAEISKLGEALSQGRRRTEDYAKDLRTLGLAYAELKKQATLIDTFRAQEEVTRKAEAALRQQEAALEALALRARNATVADKAFEQELTATERAARQAAVAFNSENESLAALRARLEAAGISSYNLEGAIGRLVALAGSGKHVFDELTKKGGGAAGGDGAVFLGLRPYELQNLSYQINDVFTQLGSGTSLSQTLAQQGGQIFQLFQLQIVKAFQALKDIPYGLSGVTGGIALLTVGVLALIRALDEATQRRNFAAQLALSVDGARFSVEKLVEVSKDIEKLGIALDEASKGARALAGVGFSESQLQPLLTLAARLTIASGGTKAFAEAVKEVGAAFGGGIEALTKFVNEYNLLDAEGPKSAERVRQLFEEGRADEARAIAFEAAIRRATDAAKKAQSGWGQFFLDFKNNYHELLDNFGGPAKVALSPFGEILGDWLTSFHEILSIVNYLGSKLPGIGDGVTRARSAAEVTPLSSASPSAGGTQSTGTSRGDRNNNPGNLEFARQEGAQREGGSGRFAQFVDLETGVAAALRQYLIYQDKYGLKSIEEMVKKATPPKSLGGDNPDEVVRKYIDAVAAQLGVKTTEAINLRDRNTAIKYVQAVAQQEGNKPPSEAVAQAGVRRVLGGPDPTEVLPPGQANTEGRKRATDEFIKDVKRQTDALTDTGVMGQAALDRGERQLADLRIKMLDDAAKFAEKEKQTDLDRKSTSEAIEGYIDAKRREFAEARLKRELGVYNEIKGLEEQAGKQDKTNLQSRLAAVDDQFQTIRNRVTEQFKGVTGAQKVGGKNLEETLADVEKLHQLQIERVTSETAQSVFDATIKKFQDEVKIAQELLSSDLPNKVAQGLSKMQHALGELGPAARKAFVDAEKASAALPQTPEILAQRQKNERELAQTNRPAEVRQFTDQAIGNVAKGVSDEQAIRDKQFEALGSEVKSGTKSFHDALQAGLAIIKETGPAYRKAIEDANADLERVRSAPTSTLLQRSKATAEIAANNARLAKSDSEAAEKVITEALRDDQERLDRILAEYKRRLEDIAKRQLNPTRRAEAEAAARSEFNPRIQQAAGAVQRDTTEGLAVPGLRRGFRSELELRGQTAGAAADTRTSDLEVTRKGIDDNIRKLGELRSLIANTEKEVQIGYKEGTLTVADGEAKRQEAYLAANTEAANILPTLTSELALLERLGGSASEIAKIKAEMAAFNSETKYASKFQTDFTKTLKDSVQSRGVQAFDEISSAVGRLIDKQTTLKGSLQSIGSAFSNLATGVVGDLAKSLLKDTLSGLVSGSGSWLSGLFGGGGASAGEKGLLGAASKWLTGLGSSAGGVGASAGAASSAASGAGGWFSGIGSAISSGWSSLMSLFHTGGLAGSAIMSRVLPRYHSGGLAHDEFPAILQRGEVVLTQPQQSSVANHLGEGWVSKVLSDSLPRYHSGGTTTEEASSSSPGGMIGRVLEWLLSLGGLMNSSSGLAKGAGYLVGEGGGNSSGGIGDWISKLWQGSWLQDIWHYLGFGSTDAAKSAVSGASDAASALGGSGGSSSGSGIIGLFSKLFSSGGSSVASGAASGVADAAGLAASTAQSAGETALLADSSSWLSSLAAVLHSGGTVGDARPDVSRVVDLALFRQARRMHDGGTVTGLSADEVPTILQKGEQVLSKSAVRNMQAGDGSNSAGGGTQVRNVLAVGDKEIAQAMNSSHGERVVLNVLKRNAPSVRQMLG